MKSTSATIQETDDFQKAEFNYRVTVPYWMIAEIQLKSDDDPFLKLATILLIARGYA